MKTHFIKTDDFIIERSNTRHALINQSIRIKFKDNREDVVLNYEQLKKDGYNPLSVMGLIEKSFKHSWGFC